MYALSASTVALHLRMSRLSTTTYEKQQVTGSSLLLMPAACAKPLVLFTSHGTHNLALLYAEAIQTSTLDMHLLD